MIQPIIPRKEVNTEYHPGTGQSLEHVLEHIKDGAPNVKLSEIICRDDYDGFYFEYSIPNPDWEEEIQEYREDFGKWQEQEIQRLKDMDVEEMIKRAR